MTREEIKKMLPILQAFAEGKTIQSRYIKGDKTLWYDIEGDQLRLEDTNLDDYEYRIKPESKYRPFKNPKECWDEMQKHQPFGWLKYKDTEEYYEYGFVTSSSSYVADFEEYTFADGTPFGIEES